MSLAAPAVVNGPNSPLSDELRRARIREFLNQEAEPQDWWAVIVLRDGETATFTGRGFQPSRGIQAWSDDLCRRLNREIHYQGCWTVAWLNDGQTFCTVWKDPDGDIQVIAADNLNWRHLNKVPLEKIVANCDQAIDHWTEQMLDGVDLGLQTFKLAAGEPRPDIRGDAQFLFGEAIKAHPKF